MSTAEPLWQAVASAVSTVDDPEYPGVSIVDLGLLESIDVNADGHGTVSLTPTFSGCPALGMIGDDVTKTSYTKGIEYSIALTAQWSF